MRVRTPIRVDVEASGGVYTMSKTEIEQLGHDSLSFRLHIAFKYGYFVNCGVGQMGGAQLTEPPMGGANKEELEKFLTGAGLTIDRR